MKHFASPVSSSTAERQASLSGISSVCSCAIRICLLSGRDLLALHREGMFQRSLGYVHLLITDTMQHFSFITNLNAGIVSLGCLLEFTDLPAVHTEIVYPTNKRTINFSICRCWQSSKPLVLPFFDWLSCILSGAFFLSRLIRYNFV